nr:hypothetical protein [Tanacetum cinerariifolium]
MLYAITMSLLMTDLNPFARVEINNATSTISIANKWYYLTKYNKWRQLNFKSEMDQRVTERDYLIGGIKGVGKEASRKPHPDMGSDTSSLFALICHQAAAPTF